MKFHPQKRLLLNRTAELKSGVGPRPLNLLAHPVERTQRRQSPITCDDYWSKSLPTYMHKFAQVVSMFFMSKINGYPMDPLGDNYFQILLVSF